MTTILLVSASGDSAARDLLKAHGAWKILEARSGAGALALLEREQPSLCLTGADVPDMEQEELIGELRRRHPRMPVVLLAPSPNERLVRALRFGAASYVPRTSVARDLVDTVSRVLGLCEERESEAAALAMRESASATFDLDNDAAAFHPLVTYVMKELERFGFADGSDRVLAGVAVEEALLNAMIHGNLEIDSDVREEGFRSFDAMVEERRRESPYRERRIRCELRFDRSRASITVADDGEGFDVKSLPDPLAPDNLPRPSGRGLLLMRSFMDEVRYNEEGNEVTLVKLRRSSFEGAV